MERGTSKTVAATTDLVVVGGGLAGVCAAITAARAGRKVVLAHAQPVLGGNTSSEVRRWILEATSHMDKNNRGAREGGVIDELVVENVYRNPAGNPLILDTIILEMVKNPGQFPEAETLTLEWVGTIPGVALENPADLALTAKLTATSELKRAGFAPRGETLSLTSAWAMLLPVPSRRRPRARRRKSNWSATARFPTGSTPGSNSCSACRSGALATMPAPSNSAASRPRCIRARGSSNRMPFASSQAKPQSVSFGEVQFRPSGRVPSRPGAILSPPVARGECRSNSTGED